MIRLIFILFLFINTNLLAEENIMILKLKDGDVKIELFDDVAPEHVKRIKDLANSGKYDGVVFHRVIDGFMAQTGDVQFGKVDSNDFNLSRAGMGGSDLPDLKAELVQLAKSGHLNIVLDLTESRYCDSSGLSAVLVGNRLCRDEQGTFVLCGLQPTVEKLVQISQLDRVLNITPTVNEAVDFVYMEATEKELGASDGATNG